MYVNVFLSLVSFCRNLFTTTSFHCKNIYSGTGDFEFMDME